LAAEPTVGRYLIERLHALGAEHVFGVPGDYVLGFYDLLTRGPLQVINTCDEQGAGFAADAYARIRGLGVVCITYCVGGLKVANAVAQAYAERSPVVVISGAPGVNERVKNPLLHHKVREFDTQLGVFQEFTVASAVLSHSDTAFEEIDRVLAAAQRFKRPVYIELPRDMVNAKGPSDSAFTASEPQSDPDVLSEALDEIISRLRSAKQPAILAGVELHRFGLQDKLLELLERSPIPVAATILSKSVVGESHPCYLGVYEGAMGHEGVREYIESSDCLMLLGAPMNDVDLGINTAKIDPLHTIYVTAERFTIGHHVFEDVLLADVIQGLIDAGLLGGDMSDIPHPERPHPFTSSPGRPLTTDRLFQCVNSFLDRETVLIADVGDALFGSLDLYIADATEYLSPAYYLSLGFAVPGAIGAQLASPRHRPLVLVGDGAFQMTGMELATAARYGLNPIVVVLNNKGYGTERPMLDGPFNDVHYWHYDRIPEVLGAGHGIRVETEDQLDAALQAARAYTDGFTIIDAQLDQHDLSGALQRLTAFLASRVREGQGR